MNQTEEGRVSVGGSGESGMGGFYPVNHLC